MAWRLALACLAALLAWGAPVQAGDQPKRPSRQHQVYFADTPDELNVYRVRGARDGKTLMIIGGIQGDEPGGFLSADLYADMALAQGNLIVVPRANYYSIIMNQRGPDGDMNRQFGDPVTASRHEKIIKVLKRLMAESDLLLNLHDGSGFFRPRWEGPMANPRRYGQSLIADADRYTPSGGQEIDLEGLANRVLDRVNLLIPNPKYHLLFNNHRTAQKDSKHKEQRLSATYYALTRCHIPAYGVETSKSLPSQAMKVRHHNLVINAFMQELGIEPESPYYRMDEPELRFLVVAINGQQPMVASQGSTLHLNTGDRLSVLHIEANYERGLNCDVVGHGSVNDLRQTFSIRGPTEIVARKDSQEIGRVKVRVAGRGQKFTTLGSPLMYFLVETQGQRRLVGDGESLTVVKGDTITVVELLSNLPNPKDVQVNFKGYVPPGAGANSGEDRGHAVDTGRELMARYSTCGRGAPEGAECYRVLATRGRKSLGAMTVEVVPAKLDYLVLKRGDGHKLVYHNGETVQAAPGERLEVVDVKSNVSSSTDLELALDVKGRRSALDDRWIKLGPAKSQALKLVVLRADQDMGHVRLKIGDKPR